MRTENEELRVKNKDQNEEIKYLENSVRVKIKVAENLSKELRDDKVKAENERNCQNPNPNTTQRLDLT